MKRNVFTRCFALFALALSTPNISQAGIYSGHSDTAHSIDPAIVIDDPRFAEWANLIDASRTIFGPRGSTTIDQTGGVNSLGDLDAADIAAGVNPGFLTVTFPSGIRNGAGFDFVIFENGFSFFDDGGTPEDESQFLFAELAYVEVSSNGIDFARFESTATNLESELYTPFGRSFAGLDPSNVHNLAGKHAGGFGTPFDLDSLTADPLVTSGALSLDDIQYVRLVDIPGNGSFVDEMGNPIFDTWLTSGSGGFDFRLGDGSDGSTAGVGVFNNVAAVPEPSSVVSLAGVFVFGLLYQRRRNRKTE